MSRTATRGKTSRQKAERRGELITALRVLFARDVMARGASYFRNGAVAVTAESERHIMAEVRGSSTYDAGVQLMSGAVGLWCSCPYVESSEAPCKHLWAVIQAGDSLGSLAALKSCKTTRARLASSFDELQGGLAADLGEEDFDDGDGEGFDDEDCDDALDEKDPAAGRRDLALARLERLLGTSIPTHVRRSSIEEIFGARPQSTREKPGRTRAPAPAQPVELMCAINRTRLFDSGELRLDLWIRSTDSGLERLTPRRFWQVDLGQLDPELDTQLRQAARYAVDDAPLWMNIGPPGFLEGLCRERRLVYDAESAREPLGLDRGAPWRLRLRANPQSGGLLLSGELTRRSDRQQQAAPLEDARFLLRRGLVAWDDRLARLETDDASWAWIASLRTLSPHPIPAEEVEVFLDEALAPKAGIDVILPETHRLEVAETTPQPWLIVSADETTRRLRAVVELQYGARRVPLPHGKQRVADLTERKLYCHDPDHERSLLARLSELGFRGPVLSSDWTPPSGVGPGAGLAPPPIGIAVKRLPTAVAHLLEERWRVEAHGKIYRRSGDFNIKVTSGTDWFALQGNVDFEGQSLGLPELLKAARRGSNTVELGDGTIGVLPEEWIARFGMLSARPDPSDSEVTARVPRAQLMLLDELCQQQPGVEVDRAYTRLRNELRRFKELEPAEPPQSFRGTLRGYQREGLAWMRFLGRLGFGGCLADDMGLGKTVQVLALLLGRSKRRRRSPPSLVVAPSSVVFNWMDEARRFTPTLRVIAYAGPNRVALEEAVRSAELIVTSYALLRNETDAFASTSFDYVVLDEAQAIKNYDTSTAAAARRLQANHRLTITGTPIENHLGELASQLDFLNPGMLGTSGPLSAALLDGRANPKTLEIARRAVRPFLLRRTKREVAPELPERTEKTLYVDLVGPERRRYDELLVHYRARIKERVAKLGLARSTPQVLEALLRLRQTACHPGLLDPRRRHDSSAKLDRLLSELTRIQSSGERSLVFSQFTSLLSIVKERLDSRRIAYEYLDGKSRDRKASVARFQGSENIPVFLISLKAGGVGLNLTAAEHVFLLDPWWNPAVEAQAIDRTHRIGQKRNVLAYKLIARSTVEEKVIELQRKKRALAQAILGDDAGLGTKLTREDLEALLE